MLQVRWIAFAVSLIGLMHSLIIPRYFCDNFDTCVVCMSNRGRATPAATASTTSENILNEFRPTLKQRRTRRLGRLMVTWEMPRTAVRPSPPSHFSPSSPARVRPVKWTATHATPALPGTIQFSPLTKRDRLRLLRIRQNFKKVTLKMKERLLRDQSVARVLQLYLGRPQRAA